VAVDHLGKRRRRNRLAGRFHSIFLVRGIFGSYNKTYGSLGAIIGFMFWIWLSIIVVLIGGELNAETEHQTVRDTTIGGPKPMGQRGATMADTLGAKQE
jgi:membrane protein